MFKKNIRARVLKLVEQKIEKAQKSYEAKVAEIEKEAEKAKVHAFETEVQTIIEKIL